MVPFPKLAFAGVLSLALAPSAFADAIVGEIFSAKLESRSPAAAVNVTATGVGTLSTTVGVLNWKVKEVFVHPAIYFEAAPATAPKVSTFQGFCIEINQQVIIGSTFLFETIALKNAPKPGTGVGPGGMGQAKANLITELYDRFYKGAILSDATGVEAAAFQLAVWNLIYDTDRSVTKLAGTFFSNTVPVADVIGTAPFRANEMLHDLAGLGSVSRKWDLLAISNPNYQDNVVALRIPSAPSPIGAGMGLIGFAMMGLRRQHRRL